MFRYVIRLGNFKGACKISIIKINSTILNVSKYIAIFAYFNRNKVLAGEYSVEETF